MVLIQLWFADCDTMTEVGAHEDKSVLVGRSQGQERPFMKSILSSIRPPEGSCRQAPDVGGDPKEVEVLSTVVFPFKSRGRPRPVFLISDGLYWKSAKRN